LQAQYCIDQPTATAKAVLAQLRRAGSTSADGSLNPDAFTVDRYTFVPPTCYRLRDGEEVRLGDAPTKAERSVFTAMTLYAFHQQSRTKRMHQPGDRFGTALGRLTRKQPSGRTPLSEDAVRRRFAVVLTASTYEELLHYLRTLVRLLRDKEIPLDYGRLAADLMAWQSRYGRQGVRLHWSRDFENGMRPTKDEETDK